MTEPQGWKQVLADGTAVWFAAWDDVPSPTRGIHLVVDLSDSCWVEADGLARRMFAEFRRHLTLGDAIFVWILGDEEPVGPPTRLDGPGSAGLPPAVMRRGGTWGARTFQAIARLCANPEADYDVFVVTDGEVWDAGAIHALWPPALRVWRVPCAGPGRSILFPGAAQQLPESSSLRGLLERADVFATIEVRLDPGAAGAWRVRDTAMVPHSPADPVPLLEGARLVVLGGEAPDVRLVARAGDWTASRPVSPWREGTLPGWARGVTDRLEGLRGRWRQGALERLWSGAPDELLACRFCDGSVRVGDVRTNSDGDAGHLYCPLCESLLVAEGRAIASDAWVQDSLRCSLRRGADGRFGPSSVDPAAPRRGARREGERLLLGLSRW